MAGRVDRRRIRDYLGYHLELRPRDIVTHAAKHLGISRQAVHRHLAAMIAEGAVRTEGRTRSMRYTLVPMSTTYSTEQIDQGLEEHAVWEKTVLPKLGGLPNNVVDICNYGFTEILNNARDHSQGMVAEIAVTLFKPYLRLRISDDGIGVFRKIKEQCGLGDEQHAIFELTKGKLTTDPEHHTGEGIFFTSRMFDRFVLASGRVALVHSRESGDWLIEEQVTPIGTYVVMDISTNSSCEMKEVFDYYASGKDDYAFSKTQVIVDLAKEGNERLISRSQAKRVLARLDRFKEVLLDFTGVQAIGPAFADEIFRVFSNAHPEVKLVPVNVSEEVAGMIQRAKAGAIAQG
jgi:anti-sigma regulatory factor (Ser/Thr protein kinase)